MKRILFDKRWIGEHGIGRFASEIRKRMNGEIEDLEGQNPVSLMGLINSEMCCLSQHSKNDIFFSPGYVAPISWNKKFVFTIHDLIHIDVEEERSRFKDAYYESIVKKNTLRSNIVLTVSEYSKRRIVEWSGIEEHRVLVVGNGVDSRFNPAGPKHDPGFSYVLYVRNAKPHKNVSNLIRSFGLMENKDIKLVLSGLPDAELRHVALRSGVYDRIAFTGKIPESDLPSYYRGAHVVTMPSLYEGFGLPALEGMASGVPVVVSETTSLPEVVGDAGLLVDPNNPESIADSLNRAISDSHLRARMISKGLAQASKFNWDTVSSKINMALEKI